MFIQIANMLHFNSALKNLGDKFDKGEYSLKEASLAYEELKAQATNLHAEKKPPEAYYQDIFVKYETFKDLIG
jgi:hypothetical protein